MAPEGEGELVVNTCQDYNEMCFKGLNGALRLVASMIARWHQLKLNLLLTDVVLARIRCFIVHRVFLYYESCYSYPVDYLLVCP